MTSYNIEQKDREQPRWWHCKIWKMMCTSGASMNSKWGLARALEIRWCLSGKGKMHLCSWSDRNHKVVADFEKKKREGKVTFRELKI